MSVDEITIGQIRELTNLLNVHVPSAPKPGSLNSMIGRKVIIRTYSAGVHFGTLAQKADDEVILENARRLWHWHAVEGICTHGVARYGLVHNKSRVGAPVKSLWLKAIEIIPCTDDAAINIEEAENAHP